ncbi:cyclin-J-like [Styela clava]
MEWRKGEWWNGDLAKDIHDTLKLKENLICGLQGNSPLMYLRRYLVDWLALTCQKFRLNGNAQHLAVTLYDRFTDLYTVSVDDLKVLVVCCLLIASKFEEREEKIPKFKLLMEGLQWQLKASDYLHMELRILSAFGWNIGFSTASHYKDFYMQVALGSHDLHVGRPLVNREEAYIYMEKNVNYFLEVSLQDPAFLVFKPSLITAACLASARICLHISPTWTSEMRRQSNFTWSHLVPCIEILLRLHDEDRKATQESAKASSAVQHQMALNSTGNTPIASPVPPQMTEDSASLQQYQAQYGCMVAPVAPAAHSSLAPIYRYNRGYSMKRT